MPTGYTCKVQDGEITNLRDFALVCARAFGALIEMRDAPMDAPIPEKIEPSDYHKKELEEAQKRLVWLSDLNPEQMEHEAQLSYEKEEEEYREYLKKIALGRSRYEKMIAQVCDWQPPEELGKLKSFMLDQLRESTDFDCTVLTKTIKRMTGVEWFSKQLEKIQWYIEYHAKNYAEDVKKAKERNHWIALLFSSLPPPEPIETKGETSQ